MKRKFITKTLTIRVDQDKWLKERGGHLNLSGLLQKVIDEEMMKDSEFVPTSKFPRRDKK
jgi:post-segregation antitoxin (ccd killing protein)